MDGGSTSIHLGRTCIIYNPLQSSVCSVKNRAYKNPAPPTGGSRGFCFLRPSPVRGRYYTFLLGSGEHLGVKVGGRETRYLVAVGPVISSGVRGR